MEQHFVYQKRRPWNEDGSSTTMINNVTWANSEAVEEGLVPEFEVISDDEVSMTDTM